MEIVSEVVREEPGRLMEYVHAQADCFLKAIVLLPVLRVSQKLVMNAEDVNLHAANAQEQQIFVLTVWILSP